MNQGEPPITGYLDRFSHRPGERFEAHVSVRDGGAARARLVRVVSADPNPAGPGMSLPDRSDVFDLTFAGARHPTHLGSYGQVRRGPEYAAGPRTWTALLWFAATAEPRPVLCEARDGVSVTLLAGTGGAVGRLAYGGRVVEVATGETIAARGWWRVWVTVDPTNGRVVVGQQKIGRPATISAGEAPGVVLPTRADVTIASDGTAHFTGKLEDPAILGRFVTAWADPLATLAALGDLLAGWDFSVGIGTADITDVGPHACHGRLVNMPTRAVVGARWTGAEQCWRHAPRDYGAIHFHDDDLDDCRWPVAFSWTVPDNLASGAYALHLTCAGGEDWLPLYVLPKRAGPFAPVVFLAATFTYQAYANHMRGNADAAYKARVAAWGAYPHNPDDHADYAYSTYNRHADGSGVAFSSRRRPVLTMRPGFLTFDDARGSGLRHYPADTHLLAWLEAKGIAFDIVTDEDLDDEGAALLAPYRAALTGTHPEYHTPGSLDALQGYVDGGGRLVCLGGNGFYWRIARRPDLPHVIELRRAEGGIRAWAAEPGEYYHALDGGYGGLWRRNRRAPQMLTGVGFCGQGKFESGFFRRLPASHDPAFAWMFEGVEGDIIGDYGLSGGGAAGFELDRTDRALGTPANAVVLARAEDVPASFVTVFEELLSHLSSISGDAPGEVMRGEIAYFDTPAGGSVFAAGSITFCGSLWRSAAGGGAFDGPVSRLLENVVRRFARA
jgi:N,N-dimethylformamidase